jgi:DNA-directed RNA polymerase
MVSLDASASFLQVLAVLSGCKDTAYQCNLTNSGSRQDFYTNLVWKMNEYLPEELQIGSEGSKITRQDIKDAAMPKFYGSIAAPIGVFGEDTPELEAFYKALGKMVPGAIEIMDIIPQCWDSEALQHCWTLPDGHIADVPVMDLVSKKIEVDELDHHTFTHQIEIITPTNYHIPLLANTIQSFDAYLAREVIRRMHKLGRTVLTIHDSFHCHANDMDTLRKVYQQVLYDMAQEPLFERLYNELRGTDDTYNKIGDISKDIMEAEYFLS